MRAGRLRHEITIQEPTATQNAVGEETLSWSDYATVRASVEPMSGREYWNSKQVQSEITHEIRIRYYPGVTSEMRVSWGNRVFEIESVINVNERNREMILMCKEAV